MKSCLNFWSILLITRISFLGKEASEVTEPECPGVEDMCENLQLDWDDLLEPGHECPASNYVDLIDPNICDHMEELFLPAPANVTFTSSPQDQEVGINGTAEFECVSDPEALYIHWYFNGRRVTTTNNPYSSVMVFSRGERNVLESEKKLTVDPVDELYYGEYTCVVTTFSGVAQASAWLSRPASGSPESCSMEFSQEPQNRLVKVGEYVKLNCVVRTIDEVTVTWYKSTGNGARSEITANSDVKVIQSGLIIPAAKSEHSATYTCAVCVNTCKMESSATVTVYSKLSEECGKTPKNRAGLKDIFRPTQQDDAKIFGGTDMNLGSIPWQVSWQHKIYGHLCGGVVLDRYWVLTAAHCFILRFHYEARRSKLRFHQHSIILRFGINKLYKLHNNQKYYNLHSKEEQVRRIRYYVVHPLFQRRTFDYDFALVKLTRPLDFNDYVRPVCLPIGNNLFVEKSRPGNSGLVSGWGNETFSTLQGAKLPIRTEAVCNQTDTNRSLTGRMFCAGEGNTESPKACKGDSGGPFVIPLENDTKWYLAGLVSWGPSCLNKNKTLNHQQGIYANVSVVASWILQMMKLEVY